MASIQLQIDSSANDGHSRPDGTSFDTSPPSGLIRVGNPAGVSIGGWWRFPGVGIAPGSTINSASLTLAAAEATGVSVQSLIAGEDADDADAPTSGTYGSRTFTAATVGWSMPTDTSDAQAVQTPDIAAIIQEIIDRPGWQSGNAIVLYIDNDSTATEDDHRFYDYLNEPSDAAILDVDYTEGATEVCADIERAETLRPATVVVALSGFSIIGGYATSALAIRQLDGGLVDVDPVNPGGLLQVELDPLQFPSGTVTELTLYLIGHSADPPPETQTLQAGVNVDGTTTWNPDFDSTTLTTKSTTWSGLSIDASTLGPVRLSLSGAKGETIRQAYLVATVEETVCSEPQQMDWTGSIGSEMDSLLDDDREVVVGV